jgi:hypothetical protein
MMLDSISDMHADLEWHIIMITLSSYHSTSLVLLIIGRVSQIFRLLI